MLQMEAPGWFKDEKSGAIINTNDEEYKKILALRKESKKSKALCKRMHDIENELKEIKGLLNSLVNGISNEQLRS